MGWSDYYSFENTEKRRRLEEKKRRKREEKIKKKRRKKAKSRKKKEAKKVKKRKAAAEKRYQDDLESMKKIEEQFGVQIEDGAQKSWSYSTSTNGVNMEGRLSRGIGSNSSGNLIRSSDKDHIPPPPGSTGLDCGEKDDQDNSKGSSSNAPGSSIGGGFALSKINRPF